MRRRPFLGALAASAAAPLLGEAAMPAPEAPQQPNTRAPTRITLLGTGTPAPSLERQVSSYLVETGGDVSCFSGTAPTAAYRDAVGHHKANALTAKRAGVKTLVLVHALGQIDQPRIREQIVHEIQQEFTGKVIWGEDLMQLGFADPAIRVAGY